MTICSYDNSGQLKFDVDIEMEQGYWNTSSSRLWTRIRDLMHDDIVTTYNNMRQNGVSYENMMHYIYDEQIAKISQTYYNKDYDIKYAPFADSYIGMAHGDTYEHVKRWLKQRFTFVDTLFDYAPSYNNDVLTIRANTTELMTLEIETYTPVYQHVSWYNGQMDKKKIDGKISVEFSGTAQAATDQEVLIYGGSNVKSIKGITSMNPNRMLIGSATKLIEIDAHDCPLLADINANKANLSPHEYLNKVDLSNCPLLEGNLRLNNSPLVQEINIKGTNITGMNLPSSIRNLQVLRLPNTMTELTLNDAGMLHTLEFDEGVNLQSVSMTNCNALENVTGLDLLQTPSITLNNSYNNVAELYFRDTTNLSLSNMSNLERVIFTPNNEYETFELINIANAPDYKVTTFNCPKLSTFMTTAPYRESYNNCGMTDKIIIKPDNAIDILPTKLDLNIGCYVNANSGEVATLNDNVTACSTYIPLTEEVDYTFKSSVSGRKVQIVFYKDDMSYICIENESYIGNQPLPFTFTAPKGYKYLRFHIVGQNVNQSELSLINYPSVLVKDYGNIQPNTTFTANSIDISSTQFTDVKLLCTTDTNTLKLPTTVKNFYCDSSFDLDTDYLEDGEYDVVHGELVEPYTTDYEGEVLHQRDIERYYPISDTDINTDIIPIIDGADVIVIPIDGAIGYTCYVRHYANYDNAMSSNVQLESSFKGTEPGKPIIIKSTRPYIRLNLATRFASYKVIYKSEPVTPNLIPSSADGSLIFSMYAPSNTVAPASGTWDLKGLKFDNFHTFGMNNDVYHARVSENIINNTPVYYLGTEVQMRIVNNNRFGNFVIDYSNGVNKWAFYIAENGYLKLGYNQLGAWKTLVLYSGFSFAVGDVYDLTFKNDIFTFTVNDVLIYQENINNLNIVEPYVDKIAMVHIEGASAWSSATIEYTSASITMPARYDDYSITIKNANISPKTHNTMLYPLLVNEDNPIEGKLDYTNYTGNNLSWSFAYVNMNKVNIVQPKDELLNTYEYRYNAFYETEYEFDDPNEVLRYITSSSNLLPTFNEGFTYTYDKLDNNDGTYIYRIYANDPTLLTSFELEKVPYLRITNAENLLSPIDLTKYETVSISESYYDITELYFREATNLTLTNMPYLERVIYLPNDEYEVFEIINVVNSKDYIITTSECPRLTTFMTTASHRESYNNEDAIAKVITEFTNTDNELFTNEYVFSKTYWEEDGTEIQGSVNLLHYEIPSIEDSVKAIHMVQGLDSTNRVTFFNDDKFISCEVITTVCELDFKLHRDCNRIVFICEREGIVSSVVESILTTTLVKEYGSVEPNIIFNANTLDISNTQFTDVKLLCTTDLNVLKLPTTIKNFYCDSSFDLDTDYLTDGEYDVVHGELVEQYTTDYEGEVLLTKTQVFKNYKLTMHDNTQYHPGNGGVLNNNTRMVSDKVLVQPGTVLRVYINGVERTGSGLRVGFWKEDNTAVYEGTWNGGVVREGTYYIRVDIIKEFFPEATVDNITIDFTGTVIVAPNLIPSSADGPLIFSMYAPSNTVAPASGVWDLHGLEFNNFHTFGMNNDVKVGEDSYVKVVNPSDIIAYTGKATNIDYPLGQIYWDTGQAKNIAFTCIRLSAGGHTITTSEGTNVLIFAYSNIGDTTKTNHFGAGGFTFDSPKYISFQVPNTTEYIEIDGCRIYLDEITIIDGQLYKDSSGWYNYLECGGKEIIFDEVRVDEILIPTSITMPARYDDYSITIKNANISPKTHNTMLYPLLVNEDNPITGTLDYTDYAGKHLSWSFAYTDEEYVNIIQPKDELLNSYEYKYNAFYDTEYEFDNPYEIARYTSSASGVLPTFNAEFTYTYDEIDNGDGTYTTKIYADSLDNLPIWLSYQNKTNLLSVEKLKTGVLVSAESMFQGCSSLTSVNISEIDVSNVGQIYRMFYGCNKLTEIQGIENLSNGNFINLWEMFRDCSSLTELDLSGFDTSNVTNMANMFHGCSQLTSLNLNGFDTSNVTGMDNMFYVCSKLTSLDVSGFDTSKVTSMSLMFCGCSSLTSIDLSGFDTSKVTDMSSMFHSCNNLHTIILPNTVPTNPFSMTRMFQSCNVLTDITWTDKVIKPTNLSYTFYGCRVLTSLDLSKWDTSELTNTANMLEGCHSLTSLNTSNWNTNKITNMATMFAECRDLIEVIGIENWDTSQVENMSSMFKNCKMLTSLNISDWEVDKVTNFQNTFHLCESLTTLDVSNWNVTKDNISAMFRGCASLTKLNLSNWGVKLTGLWYVFQGCTSLTSVNLNNVIGDLYNIDGVFSECFNLKTVYANNCTTTNLEKLIAKLPVVTPTSTIQGSVLINESLLPNGWVYDNALEVAMYTCSTSGVLPIFNTEFTYTHSETNNEDGTYTTKVVADSIDNLPTNISFSGKTTLLTVDKLNTSKVTSMSLMFRDCTGLTSLDFSKLDTSNVTNMGQMFYYCTNLTSLDMSNWDTSKVTNMGQMFQFCSSLTTLNISNWDTSKVTNMDGMFRYCSGLTTLDLSGFDTSKVTNMNYMFADCKSLTSLDVSNFDTSKVTNMGNMFDGCQNLTTLDVSNFDTSKVTNMGMMFKNCNKLTTLDVSNFDTSKVTNMSEMFSGCNVLSIEGLGNWDVKNVTDMGSMFLHCRGITSLLEISDWDTSSLKGLYRTFMGCTELIELDVSNWNTSKLETLLETFYSCSKIISFNLGNWDCRRVISISGMFQGCSSLSSVILPKEVRKGCNAASALKNCTNLKEVTLPKGIGNISHMLNNCYNLEKAAIPLGDITDVQDTTFNNCRALVDIDWVGDLSNNFNIISNTGEHVTTESDVHELMTNLGDLKKDKIKISLSKGTIKVNDTEKTIE